MEVKLRQIDERQAASLRRWVDAYFSEVAKFRERAVGPVDAAGYRYLPLYWTEPARHPFFIEASGTVVGFALVRQVVAETTSFSELAEFFIQPVSRRAGVGGRAARAVWEAFPGQWELQVALTNGPATAFWRTCIEAAASGAVSREDFLGEDGRRVRYRFRVCSPG